MTENLPCPKCGKGRAKEQDYGAWHCSNDKCDYYLPYTRNWDCAVIRALVEEIKDLNRRLEALEATK